jgi:hypothetical protein
MQGKENKENPHEIKLTSVNPFFDRIDQVKEDSSELIEQKVDAPTININSPLTPNPDQHLQVIKHDPTK